MALTAKQQAFVEAYTGNGTAAARAAGYAGSDNVLAQQARENLRNPQIRAAIDKRNEGGKQARIATRQERQEFWSTVMNDTEVDMKNRLKASELLGKSDADFTENHNHKGTVGLEVVDPYAQPKGDE